MEVTRIFARCQIMIQATTCFPEFRMITPTILTKINQRKRLTDAELEESVTDLTEPPV